ncbi:hypothetical protein PLESTB_000307100 [Pleodorina starrii]|uniref:Raffinose synthase n=1 Tax=Pleodorina starrii TaxID=330485 RepID=A0A9W6BD14_9CHLO|nr:hypothetical protein PLESTM_001717800 [Pleodorina starrii]GLC49773.1 hypothetical protein PLESTB_000307100 [Pleodorina starrii]GLC76264.1 hypothetical protein PLESTF_001757000 [Pleodorina starrii]
MTGSCSPRGPEAQSTVAMAGRAGTSTAPQQQQVQPQQQEQTAEAPPSPSNIRLTVASGAVVAPDLDYTVVLDMLHKNASANAAASRGGGVVLGLTSPVGNTDSLDIVIGQLNFKRLLACARNKLWWMTPEWRTASWSLPPETQFLLAEMAAQGPYALLLPLIDGDFRATLRPPAKKSEGANGELVLRLESGAPDVKGSRWSSVLYIGASWDPYELVDRGVAAAAALSGGARPRSAKTLPPSLDGFGWCTWDAFYSTVSARGLAEGLSSLEDGGVSPQLLIIDDGWQMTDVDPPMRKTPAAELADKLHVEGEPRRLLEATQDEFFYESQEVMAETAAQLPPGTSAGTVMPRLANIGPQHTPHSHSHSGSADLIDMNSLDSAAAAAAATTDAPAAKPPPTAAGETSGVGISIADAVARAAAAEPPPPPPLPPPPAAAAAEVVVGGAASSAIAIWLARASQKVAGWVMGIATAGFLIFYQWVVEPAPPNSLAVRAFAAAAKGFLRPAMLSFYATASDFTRRLTSVRANGKFSHPDAGPDTDWAGVPEALGTVVAHIKRKFGVRYVYCWHGLPGYWAGVMPTDTGYGSSSGGGAQVPGLTSHLRYAAPTSGVLEIEPSMAWNPAVLAGIGVVDDPSRLYNAMHRYLADSGVDGVKVDCQAGVGLIGSAMGGGAALSATYQASLESSVAHHFRSNHVINCMCHSTENIYRMTATAVARASDDFYPRDPASSHPHIAACAFNSLFLGALLQPDWDMFHSRHPAARLHAVARAVSGGPVYVSDKPGDHDFSLLHSLVLPDGSVLRCDLPGRPTRDCLFVDVLRDGKSLLKVWNTNPVTGVVGVFHLQGSSWDRVRRKFHLHDKAPRALTTEVRPYDVDAFRPPSTGAPAPPIAPGTEREFLVLSRNSGILTLLHGNEGVQVPLRSGEADVLSVARIVRVGPVAFGCVGLANLINGGGAVRDLRHESKQPAAAASVTGGAAARAGFGARELVFTMTVRGHGDLLSYCSREPDVVLLNGARLQPEVSYTFTPGAVAAPAAAGAAAPVAAAPPAWGAAAGGRLRVDLPRVSDLENQVQVVFRSFE